jgi:hypothetical protein
MSRGKGGYSGSIKIKKSKNNKNVPHIFSFFWI